MHSIRYGQADSDVFGKLSETYFYREERKERKLKNNRVSLIEIIAALILLVFASTGMGIVFISLHNATRHIVASFDNLEEDTGFNIYSEEGCRVSYSPYQKIGRWGHSIKLDYDLTESTNKWGRFRMALPTLDTREWKRLEFFVKGEGKTGMPATIRMELISQDKLAPLYVYNISNAWQKVTIPLELFENRVDISQLTGLALIFEDWNLPDKRGSIYIDEISLAK